MVNPMLYKLRIGSEETDTVRKHFESMSEQSNVFQRGLEIEGMHTEAAWLHEDDEGPVLYYYEEASDDYPPDDLALEDINDEAVVALSKEHHGIWEQVAAQEAELVEFEELFFVSTLEHEE